MSRNLDTFVPMAGLVRAVFDVLTELVDVEAECEHRHPKKCADETCDHEAGVNAWAVGLEEAAVRVAEMIERGELS